MLVEAAAAMATVPLSCHLSNLSQVFRQVFGDQDQHFTCWFVFPEAAIIRLAFQANVFSHVARGLF